MELRALGSSGVKVTPIIMGTWQAGKMMWSGIDDTETSKALHAAFEAGITTFDTAEEYGRGHSERMIGETLADFRHQLVYASKVAPNHLAYKEVIAACHRSLKNLKTDYIDLYQIHWPAGSWRTEVVPLEETMRAMNDLREQGKIRAIGVSNFSTSQIQQAGQYGPIHSFQPPYSLFWRQAERSAIPYCRENSIAVLAYSPMAQGLLTGRFGAHHRFGRKDHRSKNKLFKPELGNVVQQALARLRPIAERHDASLAQLALAWVIAHHGTCAIAGARNAQQVQENAKAAEIKLATDDLVEIDTIGRTVTDHLDDNPVMWEF